MNDREQNPGDGPAVTRFAVLAGRVMWFFFGPLVLVLAAVGILTSGSGWTTALDAVYLTVVALMVWGRWVEQRSGQAMTATGEPATWKDFRRYVEVLVPLAAAVWIAANLLGNHVLNMDVG